MGRLIFAALTLTILAGLSGCAVVVPTSSSSGYDGAERTGPYTNYDTYAGPGRPPYNDTYVVTTPGKKGGARVIVDHRYEPRPQKK